MRAIAVQRLKDDPRLVDIPSPSPKSDQLLVKVAMAGLNPFDWHLSDGAMSDVMEYVLPFVLGVDAVGTVQAVGANVRRYKVGDRIYGQFLHAPLGEGTYAEFAVVPESAPIAIANSRVSDEAAAALPTAAMTALSLIESLDLAPGSKLLIVGATGGVGIFATQFAAAKGFTVLATASASRAEQMLAFGASESFPYRGSELASVIKKAHQQGIDAVIDLVSDAATFKLLSELVSKGGYSWSSIGSADGKELKKQGLKGGNFYLKGDSELLRRLASLVESGELVVPIESTIRLEDAPKALAVSRSGKSRGKTVIRVA